MTPELQQQIEKWQAHCQHIDDLIKSCPSLDDLHMMKSWEDSMHEWLTYIGNQAPIAEAEFARACLAQYADIPPDTFKLIKNHSGQIDRYMVAKNPQLYTVWQQMRNLGRALETILSDVRTNMVSQRELDQRGSFQRTSQTLQPPSNGRDYVWPEIER